ncbi:MAG TPA: hypothetical protein PKD26_05925 [Pyrinomonadaceae bacterium]|nr:hypothetical protein [Pyrinomonadaceae bacterium]
MKKVGVVIFSLAMVLSIPFAARTISSTDKSVSAEAQTVRTTRRKKGAIRQGYAGGRWVVKRVYRGGKWVYIKTWQAAKWTGKKTYRGSRKVVSRTKKVVY